MLFGQNYTCCKWWQSRDYTALSHEHLYFSAAFQKAFPSGLRRRRKLPASRACGGRAGADHGRKDGTADGSQPSPGDNGHLAELCLLVVLPSTAAKTTAVGLHPSCLLWYLWYGMLLPPSHLMGHGHSCTTTAALLLPCHIPHIHQHTHKV